MTAKEYAGTGMRWDYLVIHSESNRPMSQNAVEGSAQRSYNYTVRFDWKKIHDADVSTIHYETRISNHMLRKTFGTYRSPV